MENNDLISRSELHRMLSSWDWQDLYLLVNFSDLIDEQKAVDAVPVVHAHWTNKKEKWHDGETYCSACGAEAGAEYGRYTYLETEYCPNCGARMDEQEAQHDN